MAVPTPVSVKISSKSEHGRRPSITWTVPTPPLRAAKHASTLGIIPPSIAPVSTSRRHSVASSRLISEAGSLAFRRMPGVSVSITSFTARSSAATAQAAVSALTFRHPREAGGAGELHRLPGRLRGGAGAGGRAGVDFQPPAGGIVGQRRDDRDDVPVGEVGDEPAVHAGHFADAAEVDCVAAGVRQPEPL